MNRHDASRTSEEDEGLSEPSTGALDGIRVLEFTEVIAGPLGGMYLSDLGAEIIKVEPLEGEPWRQPEPIIPTENKWFLALNRGKRGIALDLKTDDGRRIAHQLARNADVVIINYRPDTAKRLGIDYERLSALNERLIYMELTAFGRQGPDAHRPGYDIVVQAMSGLMATDGKTDDTGVPQSMNPAVADASSAFVVAWGVCAALFARERSGKGQKVEASLLATALALQTVGLVDLQDVAASGTYGDPIERMRAAQEEGASFEDLQELKAEANAMRPPSAYYRCYFTKDSVIALGCLSPALRRKAAEAVGVHDPRNDDASIPDLGPDAYAIAVQVMAEFEAAIEQRTTKEWLVVFDAAGVPAGPYHFTGQLLDHPQVVANGYIAQLRHSKVGSFRMMGPPLKMSETAPRARFASPALGEHTDEILAALGATGDEIDDLRRRAVVG